MDYYDIPYKVIEVNPISKKEIKWSDYKKVPILMVDGEQLVDSSGSCLNSLVLFVILLIMMEYMFFVALVLLIS